MSTLAPEAPPADTDRPEPYSRVRLTLGVLGRSWLWFLAGCLVITLVPILFGWRPYLIESGSMAPRINVGDVVVASPEQDPAVLLGRVAVFSDPDHPDRNKTHRVVRVADDGTLVTKGDANPTDDSQHVSVDAVRGMGRLLVKWVGLPIVWAQTGQWWWLALFVLSVGVAVRVVGRDHEDDDPEGGDLASSVDEAPAAQESSAAVAHGTAATRWARRTGYATALTLALVLPTSAAAFAATTKNTGSRWSVSTYSYTTQVQNLGPYLYWKLDETSTSTGTAGRTAADSSGNGRTGQYNSDGGTTYFTKSVTGATPDDSPNRAVTLKSADSCINTTDTTAISAPSNFSIIAWFKAPSSYTTGGKLIGFEKPRTGVGTAGSDGTYDRMLYMDGNGRIWFGVYNGGDMLINSATGLNDGAWHMAVGTMGSGGMRLYIDGQQVGTNSNTSGESSTGWWRAGCGNLSGWADGWTGGNAPPASTTPKNYPFQASLDEIAVFTTALSASDVAFLYFTR